MPVRHHRHPRLLALGAGLALLSGCHSAPAAPASPQAAGAAPLVGGQVLVKFQPDQSDAARATLRDRFSVTTTDALMPGVERWYLPPGVDPAVAAQRLQGDPAIAFAQPNYLRHTMAYTPSENTTNQWYLGSGGLDVQSAWNACTANPPGSGSVVAVVDTGVDTHHPDLIPNLIDDPSAPTDRAPWGKKFIDEVGTGPKAVDAPQGTDVDYQMRDGNGHGTHVAGILGAAGNNGGIVGVAPGIKILPVKTMYSNGDGDDFTIAKGLKDAADNGANVINLSVGGSAPSPILAEAIAYDFTKGATVVIASGNAGGKVYYPAAYAGVLAVGATVTNRTMAPYSNRGPELSLMAPGGEQGAGNNASLGIYSTLPTYTCYLNTTYGKPQNYGVQVGTSMATPMVSGVAALVIAEAKAHGLTLTPAQVRARLLATTTELGPAGFDEQTGFGLVSPLRAITWTSHDGVGQ